jgi:hypothetical protein
MVISCGRLAVVSSGHLGPDAGRPPSPSDAAARGMAHLGTASRTRVTQLRAPADGPGRVLRSACGCGGRECGRVAVAGRALLFARTAWGNAGGGSGTLSAQSRAHLHCSEMQARQRRDVMLVSPNTSMDRHRSGRAAPEAGVARPAAPPFRTPPVRTAHGSGGRAEEGASLRACGQDQRVVAAGAEPEPLAHKHRSLGRPVLPLGTVRQLPAHPREGVGRRTVVERQVHVDVVERAQVRTSGGSAARTPLTKTRKKGSAVHPLFA